MSLARPQEQEAEESKSSQCPPPGVSSRACSLHLCKRILPRVFHFVDTGPWPVPPSPSVVKPLLSLGCSWHPEQAQPSLPPSMPSALRTEDSPEVPGKPAPASRTGLGTSCVAGTGLCAGTRGSGKSSASLAAPATFSPTWQDLTCDIPVQKLQPYPGRRVSWVSPSVPGKDSDGGQGQTGCRLIARPWGTTKIRLSQRSLLPSKKQAAWQMSLPGPPRLHSNFTLTVSKPCLSWRFILAPGLVPHTCSRFFITANEGQ